MSDIDVIVEFLQSIRSTIGTEGWILGMSVLFYGIVQVYRLSVVQKALMKLSKIKALSWLDVIVWEHMSGIARTLVISVPAGIAAFLATYATGSEWMAALGAAVSAVIGAMGTRQAQKKLTP